MRLFIRIISNNCRFYANYVFKHLNDLNTFLEKTITKLITAINNMFKNRIINALESITEALYVDSL